MYWKSNTVVTSPDRGRTGLSPRRYAKPHKISAPQHSRWITQNCGDLLWRKGNGSRAEGISIGQCTSWRGTPTQRSSRCQSHFRCAAIRSAVVCRAEREQQRSWLRKIL